MPDEVVLRIPRQRLVEVKNGLDRGVRALQSEATASTDPTLAAHVAAAVRTLEYLSQLVRAAGSG